MTLRLKRSTKLPRGEALVIRVGDQFFAGYWLQQIKVRGQDAPSEVQGGYAKNSPPMAGGGRWRFLARESIQVPKSKDKVVESRLQPRTTVHAHEAKKFRRLQQAEAACEKLDRHYSGILKTKIVHYGDHDVYSTKPQRSNP